MSDVTRIKLNPYQEKFLLCKKRYPALVAGIGTGKTMMMLAKVWRFCEKYPDSLALIVRKEFTDLRDSTLKDFTRYFGVTVDSNKEYKFNNGSVIMFRHGAELNVLKNINLSIFGIEQAEEFETEEVFIFLRDRLRRQNSPYRQGIIIANTNGHNWIWRLWKNNPGKNYALFEATTFDNAHNLPRDFIEDLKDMERDAPNHYRQYVLNQWDVLESDDYILTTDDLERVKKISFLGSPVGSILAVDVARFGQDQNAATLLEGRGTHYFEQTFLESWGGLDLMVTTGRVMDLIHRLRPETVVVDGDGLGAGVVDRLRELRVNCIEFRGGSSAPDKKSYYNLRSQAYMEMASLIKRGWLKIMPDEQLETELTSIKYSFNSQGKKKVESKDEMRKRGLKSPNKADSLMMAVAYRSRLHLKTLSHSGRLPRRAKGVTKSLFRRNGR